MSDRAGHVGRWSAGHRHASSTAALDGTAVPPAPGAEVHRYPGSPPFADSELDRLLFRGRAREIDEVLHSILSYDLFLVYAVSGHGQDVAAHRRCARSASASATTSR